MPEDKPYIRKIFNFMQNAFGANGKLAPGAFTNDFDTFFNKITTNEKYVDKVHTALNDAYGAKGKVKKGAFVANTNNFKSRVLAPAPLQSGQQFPVAAGIMDLSNIGSISQAQPDPKEALLVSGQDISQTSYRPTVSEATNPKQPKLLEDIKAFDPLIEQKQKEDAQSVNDFNQKIFDTAPEIDVMTGKQLPISDFKVQVKEFVDKMDVLDKELNAQQSKADEFYKTPSGKLYYNLVRPVYQTFLNVGKNVAAGTTRIAGDIGGGFGLDESQRILNKTADGIVDYFDFNRLAREGNEGGFLNLTPTAQQGKLSSKNILPKAVEAISSMATLLGGARVLGGNTPALFTSSFMSTYEDYRKAGRENGLDNGEADRFAFASAGLTSFLEMISPNKLLLRPGEFSSAGKSVFKAIKDGVPVKEAVKTAAKQALKEIGVENVQEISQSIGDKIVRGGTDLITGQNRFNEEGVLPSLDEALETVVLTTIATGVVSGRRLARNINPSNIERSAWAQAAERPEIVQEGITRGIENGSITEEQAAKIQKDVADYKQIYDALNEQLPETNPNADISRIAFDAFRSQRAKEQQRPIQGIPALAVVQQQNDALNSELESNVQDELYGVPEIGTELSSEEISRSMSENGDGEKVAALGSNDYKAMTVNIQDLFKNNPEFKNYVEQGRLRPMDNEEGLRNPVIINNNGKIVDGLNRLAQQYLNGSNTARAFVELSNPVSETEEVINEQAQSGQTLELSSQDSNVADSEIMNENAQPDESISENDPVDYKKRRDSSVERLKAAWNNYGKLGIVNDPEQNIQRDKEFYSALATYVKEELLYRVNQIKGYAGKRKSEMRRDIIKAVKSKKVDVQDKKAIEQAFESAYEEISNIPGMISPSESRQEYINKFRDVVRARAQGIAAGTQQGLEAGKADGRKRGRKEGQSIASAQVANVRSAIQGVLKGAGLKLTIPQTKKLLAELQDAARTEDVNQAVEDAISEASEIVWQAKNAQNVSRAERLVKVMRKMRRNKSMVFEDVEWINSQKLPDPKNVDDINKYIDFLEDFIKSRRANKAAPDKTKKQFADFIKNEQEYAYEKQKKKWAKDLQRLIDKGIVPASTTLDDYIEVMNNPAIKNKVNSEESTSREDRLRADMAKKVEAFRKGEGDFRAPMLLMEGQDKLVAGQLQEVDLGLLSLTELLLFNNVLNNIAENGRVDGAGQVITSYQANRDLNRLVEAGDKIRQLPSQKVINKKNISNIFSALFYNDRAISSFREKVLGGVENKVSKVKNRAQDVVKEFVTLTKKNKMTPQQNARLHVISYLNQYAGVDAKEIGESLTQKLNELVDDARYVYEEGQRIEPRQAREIRRDADQRLAALNSLGLVEFEIKGDKLNIRVNESLFEQDPEDKMKEIISKLSAGERAIYDYVLDKYASLTDQLEFVTRTYVNKEFRRERNYVSQVARRKDGAPEHNPELSEETDLTYDQRSVNARPSGTTITRSKKKGDKIYYDGDFFSNFVNRYYQSLYTSEVLPDLQRSAKIVNNEKFRQYITGQLDKSFRGRGAENYIKFKNKFIQIINDEKYAPFFKRGKSNVADALISRGVRLVLGNVWQGPKQYAPAVIHNFSINNYKAVAYAMQSKGRAIMDPQYRADRAAFLKNFTGVQRSALGSEAYEKNVKRVTEDLSWWTKPLDWIDNVQKVSSFVLERADRAAQNDAYIASYITSLIKQGVIKRPAEFDIKKEGESPNKEALAYAEQMASNINNESARAYRADVLTQGDYAKYLWLLQGFSLNAYQNAMNKAKIITDNRSTSGERTEALRHFMGYLGEIGTYQLVGKWARNSQLAIAAALLSGVWGIKDDETEEERNNKKQKENIRTAGSIAADISLAGLPAPAQAAIKIAGNYGYQQWAKIEREKAKESAKKAGKKYDPKGTYLSPMYVPFYGADGPGGAADFYTSIGKKAIDQVAKAYEEDNKQSDDTAEKRVGTNLNLYLGIPSAVLGVGDLVILNNKMQQVIKNAGQEKKAPVAGGNSRRRSRSRSRNRSRARR